MNHKQKMEVLNEINALESLIHECDKKMAAFTKARKLYVEKLVAANARLEDDK